MGEEDDDNDDDMSLFVCLFVIVSLLNEWE